jgi:hypothetical protein
MQRVTAFSWPETVPAAPARATRPNFWILNSWRDLVLYVGTPLLLLPVFALAQGQTSQAIVQLNAALRQDPNFAAAAENLRLARASDSRFQLRP